MAEALKLKPCPFCGEPAEMNTRQSYRNIWTGNLETGVAIYCVGCGVQAMLCRGDIPDLEPEMVIEIWNRRAEPEALRLLREAEKALEEIGDGAGMCSECGQHCGGCLKCNCRHASWIPLDPKAEARSALDKIRKGMGDG